MIKTADATTTVLTAMTARLDAETAREEARKQALIAQRADSHPDEASTRIGEQHYAEEEARVSRNADDQQAAKAFRLSRQCHVCRGAGYTENEERADAASYPVVTRVGQHQSTHFVDAPHTTLRECCVRCGGRGVVLTASAVELITNLATILRDEIRPTAAGVDSFNKAARADLAARAKKHELERERHEKADRLEREALERAAAIRAGKDVADSKAAQ